MGDKTPPLHGGVTWENHPLPRGNEVLAVLCEDNGREHGLCSGDNCIGRGTDAHVVINRYGMSKRHAIISIPDPKANHFRLTDCGSTNGTQILLVDKNRIQLLPHSTVQVTWGTRVVFAGMCAVVRKSNVETIVLSDSEEVGSPLVLDEESTDDEGADDGNIKPATPPRQPHPEETLADNPANVKVEAAQEEKKEEEAAAHQDDPEENSPPVNEHGERSANESKEDKNLSNENIEGKRLANDDGHEDSSAEGGRESLKGDQSVADLPKDANDRPPGAECKARDNDGFLAPDPVSRPTKKPHPETKEENGNKEGTRKEKNEGNEDLPWTDDIDYTATQMFEQESRYWVRDGTQTEDFLSTQQERVWDGLDELIEEVAGKEDKEKKEDDGSEGKGERKEKAAEEGEGKEKEAKENENEKCEAQKEAEGAGAERPESPVILAPENEKGSVGNKEEEDENKENETGNSDSWDMPWIDGPSQMVDDDISMYAADRQRWEGTQMGETQCGWGDDLDDLIGGKKGEECEVEGEAGEKEGNGMGAERVEKKEEAKEKESENKEGREKVEGDEGVGAGEERIDGGDVCENKEEKREGLDGLKEENGLIDEKRKEGSEKNEEVEMGNDKVEGEEKKEDDEPEMIPNTPMGMGINGENKEGNEKEGGEDEKEVRSEQRVGSGEDEKEGTGEDRKEDVLNGVDSRGNIRTGEETSEGSENSEVSGDIERKEFTEENEESRDTKEEKNKDTSLTEKAETKTGEAENEGAVQSKKPSKVGRGRKKATPLAKITNRYPPLIPDQSETTTVPNPPNQGTEKSDTQSKPRIIPRFYAKSCAEPPATPGTPPHMTPGQSNLSTPVSAHSNTQSNPPSAANIPQEFGENADGGEGGSKREAEISTESGGKGSRGRPKKRQKTASMPTTPASAPPDHSLPLSAGSHNLRNVRVQCQDIGVMFTGIEPTKKEEAAARKIEAKLVSEPSQCTYLVADEVKRTVKFLAGLCVCKYVVTRDWLEASAKLGKQPVGPENGIERFFIRPANQKGFGIYEALQRAQAKKLLEGKSIYATPNLSMKPAQLQTIVECAGGVLLDKPPPTFDKDTIIISSVENCSHHTPLEELGYSINTIELLLTGILKQELSLGEFLVDSISTVTKRAAPALTRPPAKTKRQK